MAEVVVTIIALQAKVKLKDSHDYVVTVEEKATVSTWRSEENTTVSLRIGSRMRMSD